MRTRRSTRLEEEQPSSGPQDSGNNGEGSLSEISKESVGRLLKRVSSRKAKGRQDKTLEGQLTSKNCKGKAKDELIQDSSLKSCTSTNADRSSSSKEGAGGGSIQCDPNDFDWEEGSVSVPESRECYSHDLGREVTVEFKDLPSSTQRKPSRRASAEDKELAELVHKVHLLCLLARGRLVDSLCNDPLIQASLLSLLPSYLLKIGEVPRLTSMMLGSLVRWFHDNFRIQNQRMDKGSFKSNLAFALESREGTIEEIAALSVALFRALNLMTRFVSILDVVSLKPDSDLSGLSNQDAPRLDTRICSLTYNVSSPNQVHSQHSVHSASAITKEDMAHESSPFPKRPKRDAKITCKKDLLNDLVTEGPRRKGDAEFELQMEMALSATSAGAHDSTKVEPEGTPSLAPPSKRMRTMKVEESPSAVWSRKVGPPMYWAECYCGGEALSGRWVHIDAANGVVDGEDKVEAAAAAWRRPLRYVVAFAGNGAKDVTRRYCMRWYKISSQRVTPHWWDSVLAPLKELEASRSMFPFDASQENTLTFLEAKASDSTTPLQMNSRDTTQSSSKECIEASKQQFLEQPTIASRDSLEDMELETRALTEPLPTNQLAYKNHHLYAIEKWLSKNQTLHPKGPVLGYCSGHAVYPRSCVQTLQTRRKWLREGMQVRANEVPTKVVKRSKKSGNLQQSDLVVSEEDDGAVAIELYGNWQLELLQLPHAVNGIVPKNERGQVEVWSEKCLPHGTVHLRLPRLFLVARRLEIDYASAMVGFEFRNGRSFPLFDGIVVCTEFKDAILEAYAEEEEKRVAEEKKRFETQALVRWYQLLSSIMTRQRLENSYGGCSSSIGASSDPLNDRKKDRTMTGSSSPVHDILSSGAQKGLVEDEKPAWQSSHDHQHVFPIEDQSFDEESFIRTKRCPCGFAIQVEEL